MQYKAKVAVWDPYKTHKCNVTSMQIFFNFKHGGT